MRIEEPRPWQRPARRHLLALAWFVTIGVVYLLPALVHGIYLGPFDLLAQTGLLHRPGVAAAGSANSDLINEIIPWTTQAWARVHSGQLPLWNPDSGLGMPLAFNWQSAPFGLSALVGYAVPMRFAFDAGVVTTLVVAGSGAYALGRVLGLGWLGCVMAGTVFELGGPLTGWLGYPLAGVAAWTGWILTGVVVVLRGDRRAPAIALLAVSLMFAVFAGNPECLAVVVLLAGVFALALIVARGSRLGTRNLVRPVGDLMLGVLGGLALSAPLALPAYQLAVATTRSSLGGHGGVSPRYLPYFVMPTGFHGIPFPPEGQHVQLAFGLIVLILAMLAITVVGRSVAVAALCVTVAVSALLVFVGPAQTLADVLPFTHSVYWNRALIPLGAPVGVLAGIGLDAVLVSPDVRRIRRVLTAGVGTAAVAVLAFWLFGSGSLPAAAAATRAHSFVWPMAELLAGLIAVLLLGRAVTTQTADDDGHRRADRNRVAAAGLMFVTSTAFLVGVGTGNWQSSPTFFRPTPAVDALSSTVGSRLVAFGGGNCIFGPYVGIPPESNLPFGVHEFAIYDPIIPHTYFSSWQESTGEQGGLPAFATFCPDVATATIARKYGIAFVLERHGAPGPPGTAFVRTVGGEDLYRVPGAGQATLTPVSRVQPDAATETPLPVAHPTSSVWRITTRSTLASVLRLRLTNVPGWNATVDGRAVALRRYSQVMLEADVPPGTHVVVVTYWPQAFTWGLVSAALAAAILTAAVLGDVVVRRRARTADR